MPFPWTQKRVTRISQIVADLQSPKRGGSLVVETGFPTSLIDLFVKNRNRFRKPKSKKRFRREISDPRLPPQLPEIPSSNDFTVVCAESPRAEAPSSTPLVTGNVNEDDGVAGSGREDDGSGSKSVLATLLKMLVVVVLIVILEKITVGITVSAFALVFLECAGKRGVLFSNANVEEIIKFLTRGVFGCVLFHKLQLKIKQGCEGPEPAIVEEDSIVLSDSLSLEEIEVVETKSEVSVCSGESILDCVSGDMKWGCSDVQENSNGKVMGSCDEVSLCETKGSRSVELKSMIKKLLTKKLRGSRKEGKKRRGKGSKVKTRSEGSSLSSAKEDKPPSFGIEEEEKEVENGNRSALLLKIKQEDMRENEVDHAVTFSQECSLARMEEVKVNSEEKRIDKVGNSGYISLFVIALVGLVVGRFPALMLTMTWCFVLKIVTT